jgi:hypothetical protein
MGDGDISNTLSVIAVRDADREAGVEVLERGDVGLERLPALFFVAR